MKARKRERERNREANGSIEGCSESNRVKEGDGATKRVNVRQKWHIKYA